MRDRRWKDEHNVTHSVVRRVIQDDAWYPSIRAMVTRCASVRVPDRDLAFGEVDCMACLSATTSPVR